MQRQFHRGKKKMRRIRGAEFDREMTDTELTAKGMGLCAAAAFFEEGAVLLGFGIQVPDAPFLTLLFLWFLFAVLTGAALTAASDAACAVRRIRRRYRSFAGRTACTVYKGDFAVLAGRGREYPTAS